MQPAELALFDKMDANGDGRVSRAQLIKALGSNPAAEWIGRMCHVMCHEDCVVHRRTGRSAGGSAWVEVGCTECSEGDGRTA